MWWFRITQAVAVVGLGLSCLLFGWWLACRRRGWPVECRDCHQAVEVGPRRQLYVELWDSHGMLYGKWAVGNGEIIGSRPVGPWLLDVLGANVTRLNKFQAFGVRALGDNGRSGSK
jgi:hypothetical protein